MKISTLLKSIVALIAISGTVCASAADKNTPQQINESKSWILITSQMLTYDNDGSAGAAFQEFSSLEKCENGKKILQKLSSNLKNKFGGKPHSYPEAECAPK